MRKSNFSIKYSKHLLVQTSCLRTQAVCIFISPTPDVKALYYCTIKCSSAAQKNQHIQRVHIFQQCLAVKLSTINKRFQCNKANKEKF